jgi:diadenosine tetraphosphate (Ap4A) HIT family hydrolase
VFELREDELLQLWRQVSAVRRMLAEKHRSAGFNIGVNDGKAAGQTVGHAHIHVVPRYEGDVPDPRGGIRWIIPAKAKYW